MLRKIQRSPESEVGTDCIGSDCTKNDSETSSAVGNIICRLGFEENRAVCNCIPRSKDDTLRLLDADKLAHRVALIQNNSPPFDAVEGRQPGLVLLAEGFAVEHRLHNLPSQSTVVLAENPVCGDYLQRYDVQLIS